MASTYITQPTIARRYGVSNDTVRRWRRSGKFPQPDIYLPNGWPAWTLKTVEGHERRSVTRRCATTITENATA
jgi:hypothetical protein